MAKEFSETTTTTTYGRIDERVETARRQGYSAGYAAGRADATHELKFGALEAAEESKKFNHICELCDAEYFGTDAEARECGWELGIGAEFCGYHAD
jgi:hypothetical protein